MKTSKVVFFQKEEQTKEIKIVKRVNKDIVIKTLIPY